MGELRNVETHEALYYPSTLTWLMLRRRSAEWFTAGSAATAAALFGVFSVRITGGVVTVLLVAAWWLFEAVRQPVRGRLTDVGTLLLIAAPTVPLLLPQFLGVLQQAEIIAGHELVTHQGKKRALVDAIVHTRQR